jgi:hypothetical protein
MAVLLLRSLQMGMGDGERKPQNWILPLWEVSAWPTERTSAQMLKAAC